ncbi:MAG: lipopolysaccharide biosynthesis protein [Burkholderiaceae bacterium]
MRTSILSLSSVNAFDMATQFLIPMVLVRLLSDTDFGAYRTLWLIAGTGVGVLSLGVPASLYYFVPRLSRDASAVFVRQAGVYMAIAGSAGAMAAGLWCAWQAMTPHSSTGIAVFVGLWVFASLLDVLFSAQQRALDQARLNLLFALLRVGLVLGAALHWGSWESVLIAHLLLASAKGAACALGIGRFATKGIRWSRESVVEHARYSAPFGASAGLYLLRGRIDQWLVASAFSAAQFGLYSVAAVFSPIQGLLRSTINQVVLPEMNRMQSAGEIGAMQALNRRGNLAVALLIFPTLAFIASRAEPLLAFLFTADFSGAAPVVRTYCLMLLIESIEVTMILTAMRQGPYMMRTDAIALPIVIAVSWIGAQEAGLAGAALGGVVGALIAQAAAFWRASRLTGTRLARMQDWHVLARILLACGLSVAVVLGVRAMPLPIGAEGPVARLMGLGIDAVCFAAAYWVLVHLLRLAPTVRLAFGPRLSGLLGFRTK